MTKAIRGWSPTLLFQFGPARVEGIQCVLSRVQRGLRAYETRSIHRVGWIFQFRTFRLHQLLRFFYPLLDGGVLPRFEV